MRIAVALVLSLALTTCSRRTIKQAPPPPPPPSTTEVPAVPPERAPDIEPETPAPPSKAIPAETKPPAVPAYPPHFGPTGVFESREYRSAEGQRLQYRLYTPKGYHPSQKYPLVVFLHGASARGGDNQRQLSGAGRWGANVWAADAIQDEHPGFVLAPQVGRTDRRWVRQWRANPLRDPADKEPLELTVELIDALGLEFSIDPDRIYITGLSMGGFGTWIAVSRYPDRFAAAVPICGGGDPTAIGQTSAKIWAFHGAADRAVPPKRSREMVEALHRAGGHPRYTEYPGVGHDAWRYAYMEPELVGWLFRQRRGAGE